MKYSMEHARLRSRTRASASRFQVIEEQTIEAWIFTGADALPVTHFLDIATLNTFTPTKLDPKQSIGIVFLFFLRFFAFHGTEPKLIKHSITYFS